MAIEPRHAPPAEVPVISETAPVPAARVWWRVYRHHLRLQRNTAVAWTIALAGIGAGVVATFEDRLPTEAEREAAAATEGVPAFEALFGRLAEVGTVEGFTLSRWGMFAILVAIWGMLSAGRLLRGAEEAGHVEPLRAGAVSSRGLLGAAVAALLSWFALFAGAVGAGHSAAGMDAATSWALGATMGLLAAAFAAVGALASQLVSTRRRAMALAGAMLGIALVGRVLAASTATPDWMWWATPFGWTGFLHDADGARVRVLSAFLVLVVVVLTAAFALAQRDLHAGLIGGAERSVERARRVGGQFGLAIRLTGIASLGWAVVLGGAGLVFALLADDFAAVMADMPDAAAVLVQMGYAAIDTPEGVLALILGFFFYVGVALFAAAQTAAIRDEEATWRVEHLLVRPVGRVRWFATRGFAAALGVGVLALAVAFGMWAGTAIAGATIAASDAVLTGLNLVPAALLFLGLGMLLHGLLPRLTPPLIYGLVLAAFLLDFVGALLELPEAVLNASPFRHLAAVPVADIDATAAAIMIIVGAVSAVVGTTAFRRRDLQEA